jgi:predicted SnoaL-like aldol condensation-catalyzing enzyme
LASGVGIHKLNASFVVVNKAYPRKGDLSMNAIVKKLGLKPNMRALVVAAPAGYLKLLAPLPAGVEISEALVGTHQFVQFFASKRSEIAKFAKRVLQSAAPGALVWITYPKKTSGMDSDLSREEVWAAMEGTGWRPVTQIAIDEVWSALRFRPNQDVKSNRGAKANTKEG